jgi:hypothetical protein
VTEQIDQALPTTDLYLSWLKQALATQSFDLVSTKAPLIQKIAEAFIDQAFPLAKDLDSDVYAEFATVHQDYISQRLQTTFGQFVRPEMATTLTRHALDRWSLADNLQIAAQQQLDAHNAADLILAWIEEAKPQLNDKEWSQLQDLAQQAVNLPLLYLATTLCKKVDHKVQRETLARLEREMFQRLLSWLLDPIAPADLVTPGYLSLLLDDNRLTQMTTEQIVELIEAVIRLVGFRQLDPLAVYVNRLDHKDLNRIEKSLKKVMDPTTLFMQAMQSRRKQIGPEQSRWKRFLPKPRS